MFMYITRFQLLLNRFYKGGLPKVLLLQSDQARTRTRVCENLKLIGFHGTSGFRDCTASVNHVDHQSPPLLSAAIEGSSSGRDIRLPHTAQDPPGGFGVGGAALASSIWTSFLIFTNICRATFNLPEEKSCRSTGVWGTSFLWCYLEFRCWDKWTRSARPLPGRLFSGSFVWFMYSHQCIIPSASTVWESHLLYWFPTERLLLSKVWPVPLANLFLSWL